ncbi:MAG: hypothetical protein AAF596_06115 [Planctomycetota bacterium]
MSHKSRGTSCLVLIGTLLGTSSPNALAEPPGADRVADSTRTADSTAAGSPALQGDDAAPYRIDASKLDTPQWKAALDRLTSLEVVQNGYANVTLFRILLEGEPVATAQPDAAAEGRVVNGVRLSIPHATATPPAPAGEEVNLQISSTKLNTLDSYPGGGGMFRNAGHGDFILVEHINSTARRGGRDPVRIRSFTHHHADVWVPVPPRGQVGVLGDIVLTAAKAEELGRIVADVRGDHPAKHLQVGTITVGGPYGRRYQFGEDRVGGTGLLAPGVYNVLLPDFSMTDSRFEVRVEPGKVTYLLFDAKTPKTAELVKQELVGFESDSPLARPR